MTSRFSFLLALVLFAVMGSVSAQETPVETEDTIEAVAPAPRFDVRSLESAYDDYFSAENAMSYTGAVVTLVQDGEIVLSKGYGFSDAAREKEVDPAATPFPLGSITKTFVGTSVAQLLNSGEIAGVDAPVNDYFTRTKLKDNAGNPITVRMLATHQAGFAEKMQPYMGPGDAAPDTNKKYIDRITPAYIRPVLSGPAYSNAGIALLGYMVEDLTGQSFNDYIEENILGPANMTTARIIESGSDRQGVAQGEVFYSNGGRRAVPTEWANNHTNKTAGGMVASGDDMGRYMIALMGGSADGSIEDVLTDAGRAEAFARHGEYSPLTQAYGLTFMVNDWNGVLLAEHGGRVLAGASYMTLLPEEKIGMFVAVTGEGGTILPASALLGLPAAPAPSDDALLPLKRPLLSTLRALPLEALLGRYVPNIPLEMIEKDLSEYEGEYIAERRAKGLVTRLFSTLFLGGGPVVVSDNGDGTLTFGPYGVYEPVGDDVFYKQSARVNEGASGWSDLIVFRRDSSGAIEDAATTYTDTMFRKSTGLLKPSLSVPLFGLGFLGALTGLLALVWAPKSPGRWIAFAMPIGLISLPIIMFRSWPKADVEALSFLLLKPSNLWFYQVLGNLIALGAIVLIGFAIAGIATPRFKSTATGIRAGIAKWHLRLLIPFMACLVIALFWLDAAGWHIS